MKILISEKLENKVKELGQGKYSYKFNIDSAIYLLNILCFGTHNKNSIEEDGFISLCSNILSKTVGKNYNKYLELFEVNGIIDKINYCTDCNTCNKYRVRSNWLDDEVIEYKITNWICIKRVAKNNNIMKSATKKYNHLWKWFKSDKLKLDSKSALVELKNLGLSNTRIRVNQNSIYNFINNNKWFVRNEHSDKRLHTNITNMKSEIRKHLTYDGKKLINIDISNSQLYMLLYLIKIIHNKNNTPYIISVLPPTNLCSKEIKRYQYLVLNGSFYIDLGKKLIKENGNEQGVYEIRKYNYKHKGIVSNYFDDPKKLMKSVTFEVLFSNNQNISPEKKWFKKEFPTIMNLIEEIKKEDHTKLALLLQNIEAEAVLDITTKNIYKYDKSIPIFTIHDSIMTIKKHVDTVKRIFEESLLEMTGFTPKLKID